MTTQFDRCALYLDQVRPHIPFAGKALADLMARFKFLDAPASTKYHGAWPGGWFDHSLCVMQQLVLLTERNGLSWQREESPYIVGFFHDLCKLDQYEVVREENGRPVYGWRSDTLFKGHGDKSVLMLASVGAQLTEEEVACIRYHMGAFTDKELWSDYTRAVEKYPNVLWTHTADMIASHVYLK